MMAMTSSEFTDAVNALRDSDLPMQPRLTPLFTRAFGGQRAADHHRIMTPLWLACLRYLRDDSTDNRRAVRDEFTGAAMERARDERGA